MSDDRYRDHAAETVDQLGQSFQAFLEERGIRDGSTVTAGQVWEAFVAFASQPVTHRGAPVNHEFVQVEPAGEAFSLSRVITLEDDAKDYEGEALCFIEFEVPGATALDEDLQGITLSGPAGEMHPHGEGEEHEYQALGDLDRVVRTRVLGPKLTSSATITAIDVSGG